MGRSSLGHISCIVAYTLFGLNIIISKELTTSNLISPLALFCLRSIGAGLLFWGISLFLPGEKVERKDMVKIFAASILGFFAAQMTFLIAISRTTPMDCSIISSLSPICTMFIAAWALKEPITFKKAGGVVLSFCGVIYLIINSFSSTAGVTESQPLGIILCIANCLCFSSYLGIFKPIIAKYSVVTFMKWIFLFSTAMSLPLASHELLQIEFSSLPSSFIFELAFLIIGATFITYFLIPVGQKYIRPTLVSMYSYLQPIVAIAISIYLGMDTLSFAKILATITVFGGVILVNSSRSKTR